MTNCGLHRLIGVPIWQKCHEESELSSSSILGNTAASLLQLKAVRKFPDGFVYLYREFPKDHGLMLILSQLRPTLHNLLLQCVLHHLGLTLQALAHRPLIII